MYEAPTLYSSTLLGPRAGQGLVTVSNRKQGKRAGERESKTKRESKTNSELI